MKFIRAIRCLLSIHKWETTETRYVRGGTGMLRYMKCKHCGAEICSDR